MNVNFEGVRDNLASKTFLLGGVIMAAFGFDGLFFDFQGTEFVADTIKDVTDPGTKIFGLNIGAAPATNIALEDSVRYFVGSGTVVAGTGSTLKGWDLR